MGREEWRQFLHANLDEWLDNSDGTGHFAIGGDDLWHRLSD
jgi:hypothetical protein